MFLRRWLAKVQQADHRKADNTNGGQIRTVCAALRLLCDAAKQLSPGHALRGR